MQNDSVRFSTSGLVNQSNSPVSPSKLFQCCHCPLILKSKVYLFDHLNKVHGLDVDAALKNSGLKSSNFTISGSNLKCQHCDFVACSADVVNDHLRKCQKKSEVPNILGSHTSDEKLCTKITDESANEEHAKTKNSSGVSPLSKHKSTSNSSKHLKVYTKPMQTITKFFVTTSKSTRKSANTDDTKSTLILQEKSSSSNPSSNGVLQVNAKSSIDINTVSPHSSLQNDSLWTATLNKPKTKKESEEELPNSVGKRTSSDASGGGSVKKAKLTTEDTTLTHNEDTSESKTCNSRDFSFELSEDESEKKGNPANADSTVHFCKHCDYSDVGIRGMSNHYKSNHPYVRYNSIYIQDPSDESAMFRCMECPVEFLSTTLLKRHYKEKHPDAPNVFTKKTSELNLAFKCFLCKFTTSALKNLKEHHDRKHPNHVVGNSLSYCRYTVTGCTEMSSQLSKQKKPKAEKLSPQNGSSSHLKVKSTPLSQQPTSKGKGVFLFKCNNCTFSHKSVVVMHVHYEKSHPEKDMTIDKIKQLARFTPQATQPMHEKSANSETALEESTPFRSPSNPSKKHKTELSSQKHIRLSFNTCQRKSKSPGDDMGKSLKKKNQSIKQDSKITLDEHNLPSQSIQTFYCPICPYESNNLKSVVGHQNAKHFRDAVASSDAICEYSAEMQKKKAQSKAETSEIIPSPRSETDEQVVGWCEADDTAAANQFEDHAYADPEKLFYCSQCNYANPLVKGILNHQVRLHVGCVTTMESIIQYTALVRKEIQRTKSQPKELPFSTQLPFPLIRKSDRYKLFCHLCNYRHVGMTQVIRHYSKVHRGYGNRTQVKMYTSMVLRQAGKSFVKATVHKEISEGSLKKARMEKEAKLPKTSSGKSPPQRMLSCSKCSYSAQYVYLLRRHLAKAHDEKHLVSEILNMCFKRGALQSGYHCELCLFTHENGPVLFKHYREQHPDRKLSLNYVLTQLRIGPPTSARENKKPEVANTDVTSDADSDGSSPSEQTETKTFPCSECSFQGSSLSSVIQHFRMDHPWTDRRSQAEVSEAHPPFDSFQEPLDCERLIDEGEEEDEEEGEGEGSSSRVFKCPFCPAVLNTHHGLNTHCGLKHQKDLNNAVDSTKKVKTRMRVFKCQHCAYVNTMHQGAVSHIQRKHSDQTASPSSLHADLTKLQSLDMLKRHPSGMLKFSAYMCMTCSLLCRTATRLERHVQEHCGTAVDTAQSSLKAASKPPIKCKILLPKVHAQKLKISKAFLSKKVHSVVRCQHCPYICTTSIKLKQHVRVQHNNKYAISNGSLHRCVLCSKKYFTRKNLAGHYVMKHGKDAYLTHFVPVYMQPKQKHSESSTSTEEGQLQVYKCLVCSYVNLSPHGTLTHCQMKHPKVTVKADMLQTDKIPLSSMGSRNGKYSKQGGYRCKKCPQISTSSAKYKLHCQNHCRGALERPDKPKNGAPLKFQSSTALGVDIKDEMSQVEVGALQNPPSSACETNSPESQATQTKSKIFACHMCSYRGSYRRYLYAHYKHFHKLETDVVLKLLQKYNKQKMLETSVKFESLKCEDSEPEEVSHDKCVKCPDLRFDTPSLLLEHYCAVHRSDVKMDFDVISTGEKKKSTGLYTCNHCVRQLNGIRKLSIHMNNHRKVKKEEAKRRASLQQSAPDPSSVEPGVENELPGLESVEQSTQKSATPVHLAGLPASPVKSSSGVDDMKQSENRNKRHACKQCGRSFMSPKVLLSHERSHSTVAAIKNFGNLFKTTLDSSFSKYIIYKSGHTRPFACSICTYRTTVLGLWWSHFQKAHRDVILVQNKAVHSVEAGEESVETMDTEPPELLKQTDSWTDPGDKPAAAENSLYLEHPDVRRQLNHYNLMAQRKAEAQEQESRLCTDSLLRCELCSFNTEHLSSIRRHYMNRHGKKMTRCKQCDFFSESRKVLEMHVAMSHSTCQSVPTHQKDLCCPFCLYQTKNKNNMIDHIDLHRDNRVAPIEVRRPELSRYLRGVVFRCHKCTFMSGSAENLRLHMARHDDVRPYKCRLCFFDCTQLSDLEAHLSDKHQVMRNHELVGQVSLDQLEARSGQSADAEDGPLSNSELCSNHSGDEEMEDLLTDCGDVQQAGSRSQGQEGGGGSPVEEILLDIHTTELQKHEPDPQAGISSPRGQSSEDRNTSQLCVSPESEERDQAEPHGSEDGETDGSSPAYSNTADGGENAEAQRSLNIEASVEDNILRNILDLDMDSSGCRTHRKSDPEKAEPDPRLGDEHCSVAQTLNYAAPALAKMNETPANDIRARKSLNSKAQTSPPSILPKQPSLSLEESFQTSVLEEEQSGRKSDDVPDPCREMPVLENEYLKDKIRLLESSEGEKDSDPLLLEQEGDGKMSDEEDAKSCQEPETPDDELQDKTMPAYTCELCGRKLASSSELKLHVVRHGM
ncbi:zinc finger protein 462-like [Salarias fasciatus]|uniref:zinc finger protein 462-like n=1 Tax=Salarias fasciatus TaxID=181472 RepID=UPI001176AD38|nr:zinc finger protein 462-like [Salarias fasciatus]